MNTELETWKERQTRWIENGYKPDEPKLIYVAKEGQNLKTQIIDSKGEVLLEHDYGTGKTINISNPLEPTIKVSELREYCESRIAEWEPVERNPDFAHKPEGIINEMNWVINKFCKQEQK